MSNMHGTDYQIKLKQGTFANINTTATKNSAVQGEPHYTTDTKALYIHDGTSNIPVVSMKPLVVVTDTYTATNAENVIICNKATAFTITLPSATGIGQTFYIKNIGAGLVTVDGASSETIDGSLTAELLQYDCLEIIDRASGLWGII